MEPTNQAPTKRILIIEDEHFISELYTRALGKAGYDVKVIIDGVQGLAEAQTGVYDIILLDIMVPNLTGTEILHRLRAQPTPIKSRIIVTTNLEQTEESRQKVEELADGYVIKADITPSELVELLDSVEL